MQPSHIELGLQLLVFRKFVQCFFVFRQCVGPMTAQLERASTFEHVTDCRRLNGLIRSRCVKRYLFRGLRNCRRQRRLDERLSVNCRGSRHDDCEKKSKTTSREGDYMLSHRSLPWLKVRRLPCVEPIQRAFTRYVLSGQGNIEHEMTPVKKRRALLPLDCSPVRQCRYRPRQPKCKDLIARSIAPKSPAGILTLSLARRFMFAVPWPKRLLHQPAQAIQMIMRQRSSNVN